MVWRRVLCGVEKGAVWFDVCAVVWRRVLCGVEKGAVW